jgi:hypothetical protein
VGFSLLRDTQPDVVCLEEGKEGLFLASLSTSQGGYLVAHPKAQRFFGLFGFAQL